MRKFFTSLRRAEPASVAAIQRELTALRQQHQQIATARHRLAPDAVNVAGAAVRYKHMNDAAAEIAQRMALLEDALPAAEAREAAAAEAAEAVRRERALVVYQQHVEEAQRVIDTVLGNLPDGETLTILRDWRDRLAGEARDLRTWSNLPEVRRPPDPLSAVVDAMQHRFDRVVRARWAPKSPITLKGGATQSELSEATARVEDAS